MNKRILSSLLAFCMVLSLLAGGVPVSTHAAQQSGTLTVSQETAMPGENITLDVSIADNPGIMALVLGIHYDSSRLAYLGYEDAGLTDWSVADNAVWLGSSDSSYNGVILRLSFKVLDGAAAGFADVTVTCDDGDAANSREEAVSFSITGGGITVKTADHTHTAGEAQTEHYTPSTCLQEGSYEEVIYCTECGAEMQRTKVTISLADHQFENGVCVVCGISEQGGSETVTPKLTVSTETAKPGATASVSVSISNNPGIMALVLGLDYDRTKLSLAGFEDGGFTDWSVAEKAVWMGSSDNDYNGVILKLNFKILEDAEEGLSVISLICEDGDASTSKEETVNFTIITGGINIQISGSGDEEEELPDLSGISLDRDYLILEPHETAAISVVGVDGSWLDAVRWETSDSGFVSFSGEGSSVTVQAENPGTAYLSAALDVGDKTYAARCRVDVVSDVPSDLVDLTVSNPKVTVELLQTDYVRLNVIPNLNANRPMTDTEDMTDTLPTPAGAIRDAKFISGDAGTYFDLHVVDDRNVEIIPKSTSVANPNSVKLKGTSKIAVLIDDEWRDVETPITITVKKTQPRVTVKAVKIQPITNSNLHLTAPVEFTGVTVLDAVATAPSWLSFYKTEGGGFEIKYLGNTAITKTQSATVPVTLTLYGWAVQPTVNVKVTVAPVSVRVVFKPATLTLNPAYGDAASTSFTVTPAAEGTTNISVTENNKTSSDLVCSVQNGVLTVSVASGFDATKARTFKVNLNLFGKDYPVTVRTLATGRNAVSLTVKAAGSIDNAIPNSPVTLTVTPKNYSAAAIQRYNVRIFQVKNASRTEPAVEKDVTDTVFSSSADGNVITITAISDIPTGYTYEARVSGVLKDGQSTASVTAKLAVKWSQAARVSAAVTLKSKGAIDVIRPATSIVLTPTIKNAYGYTLSTDDLIFYTGSGRAATAITDETKNPFLAELSEDGLSFVITRKPGISIDPAVKYSVGMRIETAGNRIAQTATPAALSLKMGTAKMTAAPASVTLLKRDKNSSGTIVISTTDKTLSSISSITSGTANYTATPIGYGKIAIHYTGDYSKLRNGTVKLNVILEGNGGTKVNAAVNVKIVVS